MSKNMDIYAELDNFVEENEGQVTLTDVAKHFSEYGYQYAVDMIAKHLLCIELSNFFPSLDEDAEIAKGRGKLIEFIRNVMEE